MKVTINKLKVIVMFLFFVLISGCAKEVPKEETFVASDDALEFVFLEGQPPDRIFGDNTFDAAVLVSNKGGRDVEPNSVEMILDGGDVGLPNEAAATKQNTQLLEGIKRAPGSGEFIQGGREVVLWENLAYRGISSITDEVKTPLGVSACYNYATTASVKLCVVADSSPPCSDDEDKSIDNSGAPVKISEFKELKSIRTADGMMSVGFKFKLAKTGDEIYKIYSPTRSCSGTKAEDSNNVRLTGMKFPGLRSARCNIISNNNLISLGDESVEPDDVFCNVILNASGSYEDNLQMQVSYLVKQGISKNMQVIPINQLRELTG